MSEFVNPSFVINAILFSLIGVLMFWLSFFVLDKLTPFNLWHELIKEHNTALAIVIGAIAIGICVIIAAAIHG
jgi:uncharacterized membrane protein YjfL (UPF0719 family)